MSGEVWGVWESVLGCGGRCREVLGRCRSVKGGVEAVETFCERCWGFPCLPHTSPHLFSPLPHLNTLPHTFPTS